MFSQNVRLMESKCGTGLVLDVGGWADPWPRADYVLDVFRYETRGICYHGLGKLPRTVTYPEALPGERFRRETWITRDICQGKWPFRDKMFDFVICSHTLEDVSDPFHVCEELCRVAKAGYLETPSRLVEHTRGEQGRTGADHHHWMVEMEGRRVSFTPKPAGLGLATGAWVPRSYTHRRPQNQLVTWLFWEGSFEWVHRHPADPVSDAQAFVRRLRIPTWYYWHNLAGDLKRWLRARTPARQKPVQTKGEFWDIETLCRMSRPEAVEQMPAGVAADVDKERPR
jgi:hypothetical protein